jgi:adenylyl- and sulfurtransferase ThiI
MIKQNNNSDMDEIENKYKLYLQDLGFDIRDEAFKTKTRRDSFPISSPEYENECAQLVVYNHIIYLMQQQAINFGIEVKDLRLDGIVPDRDLI